MIKKEIFAGMLLFLVPAAWLCAYGAGTTYAQAPASNQGLDLSELSQAIDESIAAETASVESFKEQLKILKREKLFFTAALNGYQLRVSTFENLLLTSGISIAAVQKAQTELRASISEVRSMIAETAPRAEIITLAKNNIDQQKSLSQRQLRELLKISAPASAVAGLKARTREISRLLAQKEKLLSQLDKIIVSHLDQLNRIDQAFADIAFKFTAVVKQLKEQHLFERRKGLFSNMTLSAIEAEMATIKKEIDSIVRTEELQTDLRRFWKNSGNVLVAFILLLAVLIFLLKRLNRGIARLAEHALLVKLGLYHQTALRLLNSLFFITGVAVLIYLYSYLDVLYLSTAALRLLAELLFVLIFARFLKVILDSWSWEPSLPDEMLTRLKRLITVVQYFCWLFLIIDWSLGSASILLLLVRILFELFLIGWAFKFWRGAALSLKTEPGDNPYRLPLFTILRAISYLIGGMALILDMIGFGPLATLWLAAWGRTIIVMFCWFGFYRMLQEWDHYYREKSVSKRDELLHDEYPWQWLMIRIGQLVCVLSLAIVLILAWGGQRTVLLNIYTVLGYPLKIGNMTFSFIGVVYSVLILLATHGIARLWRWMFQKKFLSRSGMAIGLQDSITTITVYGIWILGIMIAMHVFGLNTATMAVALGGLGIGIGFGLQNIVNNFISGIILLFERPIQVGDDVEINGTWATVKKINVRSTVVQSYDNASLIIPNSEFISRQVTNWSFKDRRLRRNVEVGVAYGSDIERVRETLLEIAGKTKRVLKYPAPEVLFTNFGDSALIFRLRFWTAVDYMLKVETAVRFEIDRLFKERDIVIAFPQRDIHIRSNVDKGPDSSVSPDDDSLMKQKG